MLVKVIALLVSFSTVMSSVVSLVSGLDQLKNEIKVSEAMPRIPGDCFITTMDVSVETNSYDYEYEL